MHPDDHDDKEWPQKIEVRMDAGPGSGTERRSAGWDDQAAVFDDGGFDAAPSPARHPRRRREDRESPRDRRSTYSKWARAREELRERGWGPRRELLHRLRQPVIGLTLAGAAAPIAMNARARTTPAPGTTQHASAITAALAPAGGMEDEVARRWRAAHEEAAGIGAREDTVHQAVERFGIAPDLAHDILDAAEKNGIDPKLAFGLVKTESMFKHNAVSGVGARGLTQVMPRTARWLRPGTSAEDLFDRKLNLDLGFGYLRDLIDRYHGNEKLALTAYNRGPGIVDRIVRRGADPDNGYAGKVLSGWDG